MTNRPVGRGPARAPAKPPAQTVFRAFVRNLEKIAAAKPAAGSTRKAARKAPITPEGEGGP